MVLVVLAVIVVVAATVALLVLLVGRVWRVMVPVAVGVVMVVVRESDGGSGRRHLAGYEPLQSRGGEAVESLNRLARDRFVCRRRKGCKRTRKDVGGWRKMRRKNDGRGEATEIGGAAQCNVGWWWWWCGGCFVLGSRLGNQRINCANGIPQQHLGD
jgi:hypothetical protein